MEVKAPLASVPPSGSLAASSGEDRIWFAQMLRGIAALTVVYFHLGELFWVDNEFVAKFSYLHPIALKSKPLYIFLTGWLGHNRIELGDFGVALFFLISGFVIPFSIFKVGNAKFLLRRCLRIYPTYIVGLSFTTLVILLECHLNNLPVNFTARDFLANATLTFDIFPCDTIDKVNWTLITEMRFYLLCILLNSVSSLRNPFALAFAALLLCGSNFLLPWASSTASPFLITFVSLLGHYSPYLIFMFIGVGFHNLFQSTWPLAWFLLVGALLLGLFYTSAFAIPSHNWVQRLVRGYTLALAVFSLVYLFRHRLKPHPVLNFFAEISFPLYVIHGLAGYALLTFLFNLHPFSLLNLAETVVIFIFLSYLLHVYVEVPTNRLGHLLTKKKT